METANKAIGFTPSMLWDGIAVVIGVGVIALLIMNLISKYRELRKPNVTNDKTVQEKLKSDHDRLCKLESTTERQDKELKLILRSQMDIIHHMVDGNGTDRLKETQRDIETYLITGKIRERED